MFLQWPRLVAIIVFRSCASFVVAASVAAAGRVLLFCTLSHLKFRPLRAHPPFHSPPHTPPPLWLVRVLVKGDATAAAGRAGPPFNHFVTLCFVTSRVSRHCELLPNAKWSQVWHRTISLNWVPSTLPRSGWTLLYGDKSFKRWGNDRRSGGESAAPLRARRPF